MRIIADSSELRPNSLLPEIEGIEIDPSLEQLSGADFIITPLSLPVNSLGLIEMHLKEGARLVQRKTGMDFIQSLGTRMNESLARMRSCGASPFQCVLLIVGEFTLGANGNAHLRHLGGIDDTNKDYWLVHSAMTKWTERGGIVEMIPDTPTSVARWIETIRSHHEEFKNNPIKKIWPEKPIIQSEAAQLLEPISDGRVTLATLPGIGEKTIESLLTEFNSPATALVWLTMPKTKTSKTIKGIGEKTIENVRRHLGLEEHEMLAFDVVPEFLKPSIAIAAVSSDENTSKDISNSFSEIMKNFHISEIILSDEKSDKLIIEFAQANNIKTRTIKINWNDITHEKAVVRDGKRGQYNAAAPFIRNWEIAQIADKLLLIRTPATKQTESLDSEFLNQDKERIYIK